VVKKEKEIIVLKHQSIAGGTDKANIFLLLFNFSLFTLSFILLYLIKFMHEKIFHNS